MKSNKIKALNESKTPIIAFDKELEKLEGTILFPKQLERANQLLKKYGLPKEIEDRLKQR